MVKCCFSSRDLQIYVVLRNFLLKLIKVSNVFLCYLVVIPIDGPPKGSDLSVNAQKVVEIEKKSPSNKRDILRPHLRSQADKFFLIVLDIELFKPLN